jgi:hypothetical protein
MTYCKRTADTPSIGAVVPPDCFGEKAHRSSLFPTEGYCLRVYSSSTLSMLKFPMFFFLDCFFTACFLLVNLLVKIYRVSRKISYNRNPVNRIPVMAPLLAPILRVHFFRGHISLKNGTFCPLFSHDSSSFKGTGFLTRLKVLPDALYGPHLHCRSHRPFVWAASSLSLAPTYFIIAPFS